MTLPRFDLMAQLDKVPEGMTLSDVSKRMMVSNGNVTGLVERLVESGHLDRRTSDADRRVQVIRLTKAGRAEFRKMAAEHELWIADIFADLTPKDVTGKAAEKGLDRAWLTCNKNGVPFDKRSPFVTSGIRLGTPAATTRGFREEEFRIVGQLIAEVVEGLSRNGDEGDGQVEQRVRDRVADLCAAYPIYPEM